MRHASLASAVAIILIANVTALIHVAHNRSGSPDADVTLTNRELTYFREPDNSGVDLRLEWLHFDPVTATRQPSLDEQKLRSLGFDCSVAASDPKAASFYRRQIPRSAFVALENNGPAWQAWLETFRQSAEQRPEAAKAFEMQRDSASRLMAIDVDANTAALRSRHPDRASVLILPAVIEIGLEPETPPSIVLHGPARISGSVRQIPYEIHVPKPFSDPFLRLPDASSRNQQVDSRYLVHLRYGSLLEPCVTGVEMETH